MNKIKHIVCLVLALGLILGAAYMAMAADRPEADAVFTMEADINVEAKTLRLGVYLDADYELDQETMDAIGAATLNVSYPMASLSYQKFETVVPRLMLQVKNNGDYLRTAFSSYNPIPSGKLFDLVFEITANPANATNFEFKIEVLDVFAPDNTSELTGAAEALTVKFPPDPTEPPATSEAPTTAPVTDDPTTTTPVTDDPTTTDPVTDDPTTESPEPSEEPEFELGDVNMNNRLDAGDATMILRHVVGAGEPLSEQQQALADVNESGTVDAGDATLVLRAVVS